MCRGQTRVQMRPQWSQWVTVQRMLDTDQVTAAGTISPLYRGQIDRVCDICTRAPARGSWSCICDDHAFTIQNARGRLSHSLCLCPKFPQRSRAVHHQRQTRAGETAASFLPGNNRPLCLAAGGGGSRGATLQLQARLPRVTRRSAVSFPTPTRGPASFDIVAQMEHFQELNLVANHLIILRLTLASFLHFIVVHLTQA